MGGLVQIALALSVFAIMTGLGVGELAQYAQSKLPYTIVQRVVSAANLVNNAASSYIVQNTTCIQNGIYNSLNTTGCPLSTNLLSPTWLPAYLGSGSGVTTGGFFETPDSSKIIVGPGATSTEYTMTIIPGPIISDQTSYVQAISNALPGATCSPSPCAKSSEIIVTEATPSMQNEIAANKPAWGTLPDSGGSSATQSTNGGSLNTCGSSCGQIYSGQLYMWTCGVPGYPCGYYALSLVQ